MPTTLATLDFRSPYYFANAATGGWMTKPAAASKGWRWKCNEASGALSDDMSGDGVALTKTGTAYYQNWTPLIQSGGFTRKGVELNGVDCRFVEAGNAALDFTTESFGCSFWLRYNGTAGGVIIGKRTAVGLNGYQLMLEGSTGRVYWNLCDGTSRGPFYICATGTLTPGTWNFISTHVDRESGIEVWGCVNGAETGNDDISALTGSVTSATPFRFGSTADPVAFLPGCLSEVMVWKGGLITLAEHQTAYANAFSDPNDLLTYSRSGGVAYEVAEDAGGYRVNQFSAGQVPFAYSSTLVGGDNGGGLGLPSHGVVTNLCLQSEDPTTTWTLGGSLTRAKNAAEAPNGAQTAGRITAVANGDYLKQSWLSGYTGAASIFVLYFKRNGGSDVNGSIRVYKNSDLTERANVAFTAGATWGRVIVSATTDTNDTAVWIVLNTAGESIFLWGMQLTAGAEWPGVYVSTTTASAASAAPTITITTPSSFLLGASGTIDATIAPTYAAQVAAGAIIDGNNASSQILLERTTAEDVRLLVKDGAGASAVDASTTAHGSTAAKHIAQGRYHATGSPYSSKHGDAGVGGTRVGNGDANWTAVNPTAIGVGCLSGGTAHLNGIIALVEAYR